ncbi:hypothetical protein M885DRAFT_508704 [Pelagophyceae sp. CCMP2097]|nr:hypothetical protein M885DRAFT_508704 [Pelagophyceae sp. CCMP2097]|mmetsp:Transcript_1898/g.6790  ORF Transcript_1898/g.6790 Transcript_1898/m.6790 type:complete len:242 (-) Transcript_1898:56-781(-)
MFVPYATQLHALGLGRSAAPDSLRELAYYLLCLYVFVAAVSIPVVFLLFSPATAVPDEDDVDIMDEPVPDAAAKADPDAGSCAAAEAEAEAAALDRRRGNASLACAYLAAGLAHLVLRCAAQLGRADMAATWVDGKLPIVVAAVALAAAAYVAGFHHGGADRGRAYLQISREAQFDTARLDATGYTDVKARAGVVHRPESATSPGASRPLRRVVSRGSLRNRSASSSHLLRRVGSRGALVD